MLNRNALESLNENSLIVNNVMNAMSEHRKHFSLFRLSSRTRFFLRKEKLLSPFYLVRRCVIAALVQSGPHDNKNNRTLILRMTWLASGIHLILYACDLYKVQRDHLSFQNFSMRSQTKRILNKFQRFEFANYYL